MISNVIDAESIFLRLSFERALELSKTPYRNGSRDALMIVTYDAGNWHMGTMRAAIS